MKKISNSIFLITAWVYALDEDDEDLFATRSLTEPTLPSETHAAHHNTTPGFFGHSYPPRGRLHDHEREWTPPLPRETVQETGSRWRKFAHSSLYPRLSADLEGEVVTQEWLVENGPDYSQPWLAGADNGDPEKGNASIFRWRLKRRAWYEKLARTTLRSPLVPLVIRMVVFGFSMIALALACSIYTLANRDSDPISGSSTDRDYNSTPSTLMAIAVDAVAMVYLLGVTYDEYSGKPLGLRPPSAKMRLIFLDLFFIVFDSANLSLAFEALGGNSNCGVVCNQQRALASVLLIALLAWLMTFSISVMRYVQVISTTFLGK